jgi:hypothetical protein
MIIWGGSRGDVNALADGAACSLSGDQWRDLRGTHPKGRFNGAASWTGQQMVVWGGLEAHGADPSSSGLLYDIANATWREF